MLLHRIVLILVAGFWGLGLACAPGLAHEVPGAAQASAAPASKPARKPRAQLGIDAAFAPDGSLWWVGLDGDNQLTLRSAPPAQGTAGWQWSAPRVLATGTDPISADGENHPKLLFGPNALVLIAYTMPLPAFHTGWVRMLRSTDGGQSFSAPFTVHADQQPITHRFESIGLDARGQLHAVWIDSRDAELAPRERGRSRYRGAAIYTARSDDGGATFGPDTKVADHSCECCRIALTRGNDGQLHALWRHVFEPDVRDHAFATLGTQPTPAVRASFDDWHIKGCPHHGPGLAPASDGGFHATWFGIRQEGGQAVPGIRYGRLQADGSPVADSVRRVPDERAEHADVAAFGQRVAVVWRSTDGMTTALKAWLSADGGQHFQVRTLAQAVGDNDHPRLAQRGEHLVVVWRTQKEVQVHDIPW